MTDIAHDIVSFKLEYNVQDHKVKVAPDDLYQQYLKSMTMLSDDSRDWEFHLVSDFLSALPEDLRESMRESLDFVMSRLSYLQTKSAEVTSLNKTFYETVASYRKSQKKRK